MGWECKYPESSEGTDQEGHAVKVDWGNAKKLKPGGGKRKRAANRGT